MEIMEGKLGFIEEVAKIEKMWSTDIARKNLWKKHTLVS